MEWQGVKPGLPVLWRYWLGSALWTQYIVVCFTVMTIRRDVLLSRAVIVDIWLSRLGWPGLPRMIGPYLLDM